MKTVLKVQKWGNSHGIRLSKDMLKQMGFTEDDIKSGNIELGVNLGTSGIVLENKYPQNKNIPKPRAWKAVKDVIIYQDNGELDFIVPKGEIVSEKRDGRRVHNVPELIDHRGRFICEVESNWAYEYFELVENE